MVLVCAECQCAPEECVKDINNSQCKNCIKRICCCIDFHHNLSNDTSNNLVAFQSRFSSIITFLGYAKRIFAAALGIEICALLLQR